MAAVDNAAGARHCSTIKTLVFLRYSLYIIIQYYVIACTYGYDRSTRNAPLNVSSPWPASVVKTTGRLSARRTVYLIPCSHLTVTH